MTSSFAARLARAAAYADERFAGLLLAADPLDAKLSAGQRREIIDGALACGTAVAARLAASGAGQPPSEISRRLGVAVTAAALPGGRQVLSLYEPDRREILLNEELLERLERGIAAASLGSLFGGAAAAEIAVAHELFHHVEAGDEAIFSRSYRVTLWRIGPLRYRSRVPAAGEIAAMACSKALCRLPVSPLLLEAVLLAADGDRAAVWLDRLEQVNRLV